MPGMDHTAKRQVSSLLASRRELLLGSALLPAVAANLPGQTNPHDPRPGYTLSANIEIMFPREMPRSRRMEAVAAQGITAYSFWNVTADEEKDMLAVQKRTGLVCASIAGSGRTGWTTGLTKTGSEAAYLDAIKQNCEVAKRFGGPDLIVFAGEVQKDTPWETQYRQIISGLRKAGDIAEKYGVYICLEPLNHVESPQMSVLTAEEGFKIVAEVNHPRVKLDFDMYHLQLSEGNLINNLTLGLEKGWIHLVQIGDVPGRKEPGTGEVNYANIFKTLRTAKYSGFVDMEHGTTSTPEHAIEAVKRVSGVG